MKKKYIIASSIIGGVLFILAIFLICFFTIPRITYGYDKATETYYVSKVYGNASSYTILDFIDDKPVTKIQSRAFMNKTRLKRINLGKNITEIDRLAFLNCKNLEEVDLTNVEEIGRNAFENCTHLKEVSLGASNILGGAFMGCTALEKVTLLETESIGSYAFGWTAIEEITIPSSCRLVGEDAFYECSSLKKIVVLSEKLMNNDYLKSLSGVLFVSII